MTASFSGFVNGETLASSGVSGSPSLPHDTAASPVGTYTITAAQGTLAARTTLQLRQRDLDRDPGGI